MEFLKRTVTAIVFASVMLFCILKGAAWFIGLFALITILSTIEYTGLANKHKQADTSRLWATVAAFTFYAAIVGISIQPHQRLGSHPVPRLLHSLAFCAHINAGL